MTLNLTLKNANEDFLKAIKAMAKLSNVKVEIKKESSMDRAIEEIKNNDVVKCKDFLDFKKKVLE